MTFYSDDRLGSAYVVAGSGGDDSSSSSHSVASAHSSESGSGYDACGGATLIHMSMQGNDYSDINGVENVEYQEKTSCPVIVGVEAAVVEEDNLGVLVGVPVMAALLVALALLVARKMRDDREEMSLVSPLDDFMGPAEDPYANTIDVHRCTSIYCNVCNSGLANVSFIPASRKVDLNKTRALAGLTPVCMPVEEEDWFITRSQYADSDTVTGVHNGSTDEQILAPETFVPVVESPDDSRSYLPVERRPLTTVREISNDSEIDTELESLEGDDDASIPPPPPPSSSGDEMSI